jgi:D-arabinitol 4-dehydrogenase
MHAESGTRRILHLGLGAFHRAHQAVYLQKLHDAGDRAWTLASGNIRPDDAATVDALRRAGGAYTLETITPQGERSYQRITAISQVLPWDPQLSAVMEVGADPATRIVSFTVTEAGYYLSGQDDLDLQHPDVAADLQAARAGAPGSTIYGALCALLRARTAAGAGPLTLMSCDNLRHNGGRSRKALLQFLEAVGDASLLDWARTHTTSPDAMVDRITPRPTPEVAERVRQATGVADPAALMAESFIQWVVQDDFAAGRPAWEQAGVQMVSSVAAFEEAKIRLLNATHSCIAWAGTLAGHGFIHEGARDPRIRQLAHEYVTEDAIPALGASPLDLPAYRDLVLDRFCNAAILDTNQRVASDSFAKIPTFIVPTIRDRLAQGHGFVATAALPVLFLAFLQQWHRGALPFAHRDQAMDEAAAHAICASADPLAALAAVPALWGPLASHPALLQALRQARQRLPVLAAGG